MPTKRRLPARSAAAVLEEIDKGKVRPAYILIGDDSVLAEEIIRRLRSKLLAPGLEAFDYENYQADDLSADTLNPEVIGQHLRQPPTGSERRLVVVTGITRAGARGPKFPDQLQKRGVERLLEAAADCPDSATIVLTGIEHGPLATLLAKHKLGRALVSLRAPDSADLLLLVRRWAEERRLKLAPDAARELLAIAGEDTATIRTEIDKLATCFGPGERIESSALQELVGSSRAYQLREYVSRVVARDALGALKVLRELENWGEEVPKIIGWLTTAFLGLVGDKAASNGDYPQSRRGGRQADNWNPAELNRSLQQLYLLDRAFLTGRPEPYARLALFTHCIGCQARPDFCDVYRDERNWESCVLRLGRRSRLRHV